MEREKVIVYIYIYIIESSALTYIVYNDELFDELTQSATQCLKYSSMFWPLLFAEKTKRLKEAKEEAQAEIENFRKEREKSFQDYQREVIGLVFLNYSI